MTSPILGRPASDQGGGFTLVELLVVIGIVALLLGILVPMVSIALKHAKKTRIAASLQTISTALEAYKRDFGDYPRLTAQSNPDQANTNGGVANPTYPMQMWGARLLVQALIAPDQVGDGSLLKFPDDGKSTEGFRLGNAGRTYGPYLKLDSFKISDGTDAYKTPLDQTLPPGLLLDGYGNPILYYPAAPSRTYLLSLPPSLDRFVGDNNDYANPPTCLYNYHDNDMSGLPQFGSYLYPLAGVEMMRCMLGDWNGNGNPTELNETTLYQGPYLLWSAGPDGFFGPVDENGRRITDSSKLDKQAAERSDDVTNFPR